MVNRVLITRVEEDEITKYLSVYIKRKIKSEAEKSGFKIIDLHNERATKKILESVLKSLNPLLILFNGHGNDESIFGYRGNVLVQCERNVSILCGRIVYALTCSSANVLGDKAVNQHGTLAFIGYKEPFIALNDDYSVSRPLDDEIAKPFIESAMKVSESLVKGNTTGESLKKSKDMYNLWIAYYRVHSEIADASDILQYLIADRDALIMIGDTDVRALN